MMYYNINYVCMLVRAEDFDMISKNLNYSYKCIYECINIVTGAFLLESACLRSWSDVHAILRRCFILLVKGVLV